MNTLNSQLVTLLFLSCVFSFGWAMRYFFVRQGEPSRGLRLTMLVAALFAVLHATVLWRSTPLRPLCGASGALLYLLALVTFWSAIRANRSEPLAACFATGEELHLVQHGPYRLVRHPFYCSYLLTWLGGAVATLSPLLGLSFLLMFALYLTAARNEERKFASSPLAEKYHNYERSTGRFFPNPAKLFASHR